MKVAFLHRTKLKSFQKPFVPKSLVLCKSIYKHLILMSRGGGGWPWPGIKLNAENNPKSSLRTLGRVFWFFITYLQVSLHFVDFQLFKLNSYAKCSPDSVTRLVQLNTNTRKMFHDLGKCNAKIRRLCNYPVKPIWSIRLLFLMSDVA